MTLGDALGLSDSQERLITRGLQVALIGIIVFGIVTIRLTVVATASLGLGVTLLPALLRRRYSYSMDVGLVLWITIAMVLHVVGTIGLYDQYQWYDEVTHTVSATIIAGIGYATFRAFELHSEEIDVPSEFRAVFILVFVLGAGMIWEVVEFAFGGLIPVYGIDDIVTDLVFNAIGAVIVVVWGTGYADGFVAFFGRRIRSNEADR
jgi:hypothetical protein